MDVYLLLGLITCSRPLSNDILFCFRVGRKGESDPRKCGSLETLASAVVDGRADNHSQSRCQQSTALYSGRPPQPRLLDLALHTGPWIVEAHDVHILLHIRVAVLLLLASQGVLVNSRPC